jgi:AcrR family transcriptional regulator
MKTAKKVNDSGSVRERIMAVATDISAKMGLDAVSVRDIAATAQTSLSAINYHFGSKTGLLEHLVREHLEAIDAIREPLLVELEQSGHPDLRAILKVVFLPNLNWMFGSAEDQIRSQFFSRALVTPISEIQKLIDENVTHLDRIVDLLEKCDLDHSRAETYWRLHFTMGIEHLSFFDLSRHRHLARGLLQPYGKDELLERMIDYAEAGWRRT